MRLFFRHIHAESISAVSRVPKKAIYSFCEAANDVLSVVPMYIDEWKSKTRPFLVCRLPDFARNVMKDLRLVAVGQVVRPKDERPLLEQRHHPWRPPVRGIKGIDA